MKRMAMRRSVRAQFNEVGADIFAYFTRYGGAKAMVASPFTIAAAIISLACAGTWLTPGWPDVVLQILPNLLGFALAAYALLLGFGDEDFRQFLAISDSTETADDDTSLFTSISSTFLHFVVVQIIAITLAIIGRSHPLTALYSSIAENDIRAVLSSPQMMFVRDVYAYIAYTFFVLSITTSLASALNIFRTTRWYVRYRGQKPNS